MEAGKNILKEILDKRVAVVLKLKDTDIENILNNNAKKLIDLK